MYSLYVPRSQRTATGFMPEKCYQKNMMYLGNKMSGIPHFNAPWFDSAAKALRELPSVGFVFNPADHDREAGFEPMNCPHGTDAEARAAGFDPKAVLAADWNWIAYNSDGLIIGPDWMNSPGTISEIACHQALKLPVWEFGVFRAMWDNQDSLYALALPPIMELGGRTGYFDDWKFNGT